MIKHKFTRRKMIGVLGGLGVFVSVPLNGYAFSNQTECEVCKSAWNNLSEFNRTRYQFRYIEPKSGLPNVFIYGDSISIAYTEYVRASLRGKANVFRLHVNGESSDKFTSKMDEFHHALFQPHLEEGWNFNWDLIHFNVGLHDLKYLKNGMLNKEDGKQVSTRKEYKKNLETIVSYLKKKHSSAKLIYATTTPVPKGAKGRFAGDAKRYNKLACKVMRKHNDVEINDLYHFTNAHLNGFNVAADDVHFTSEGARLQGIEVAKHIGVALNITPVKCPSTELILNEIARYQN